MKIGYIINPAAGRGKALDRVPAIIKSTEERGSKCYMYVTDRPGDGLKKATEAVYGGCDIVVAVGGDGTVNETLNGIMKTKAVLGVIPLGSGNDFARTIGIPLDFEDALGCILRKRTMAIDVGTINDRYFVNVTSVGFDAQVVKETKNIKRNMGGPLSYVLGVLKALIKYRPFDMVLHTEDQVVKQRSLLAAVANGKFYGGGMCIAPGAMPNDGLFDVCCVKDIPRYKILSLFPLIYSGKHIQRPEVKYFRAKRIHIECPDGYINSDGEIVGPCPADMFIWPNSIDVIVP